MSGFSEMKTDIDLAEASQHFATIPARVQHALSQKSLMGAQSPPMVMTAGGQQPYNGQIPTDLTQLTDEQLGWYLGILSEWLDYVQQQLSEAQSAMNVAEAKLKFVEAHLLMIHKLDGSKKRPEPERKAMVLIDRRYVESQTESIYYETYYRHVKALADVAEQKYSSISRRISQRQQDIERQKRTNNVGGMVRPVFPRQG